MTVVIHQKKLPSLPSGLNMCKLQEFKKGSTLCKDREQQKKQDSVFEMNTS